MYGTGRHSQLINVLQPLLQMLLASEKEGGIHISSELQPAVTVFCIIMTHDMIHDVMLLVLTQLLMLTVNEACHAMTVVRCTCCAAQAEQRYLSCLLHVPKP